MRGGRCPHRGLAALIPRLTAHHISLMVSLMIQLLFLKSRPRPSTLCSAEGLAPGTRRSREATRRAPEPARGVGRRVYPGSKGELGAHLRPELQRLPESDPRVFRTFLLRPGTNQTAWEYSDCWDSAGIRPQASGLPRGEQDPGPGPAGLTDN